MAQEKLYCWACYANYAELVEAQPYDDGTDLGSIGRNPVYTHFCPKCRMPRSDGSYKDGSSGTVKTEKWLRENCTPDLSWQEGMDK